MDTAEFRKAAHAAVDESQSSPHVHYAYTVWMPYRGIALYRSCNLLVRGGADQEPRSRQLLR